MIGRDGGDIKFTRFDGIINKHKNERNVLYLREQSYFMRELNVQVIIQK